MSKSNARLLVEEIKYIEDPSRALEPFLSDNMPFLLESVLEMERYGRYSILGSSPVMVIRSKRGVSEVIKDGTRLRCGHDPLKVVDEAIKSFDLINPGDHPWMPFTGGMVGYFGYDLNRQIERIPDMAVDDQDIPDIYLGFYTEAIVIDHKERRSYALAYLSDSDRQGEAKARQRLDKLIYKIKTSENLLNKPSRKSSDNKGVASNLKSNLNLNQYRRIIEKAKEYISIGDIFQVNLAQRFEADLEADHYTLYRKLRETNPAPFAAFLKYDEFSILSSSPERFMFADDRYVETRPIKGTRPRYQDIVKDKLSAFELLESEKDSAEHVMIVDVKRNDLGRVCEYGSVKVPELMVVESYETVHHMVSTVTGKLRANISPVDLLKASFPGGSITGAPKIRAMEIIEELEPHRRNLYTGSIGYISMNGKMDTNIAIRTITAIANKAYFQVGGGIVADSEPDDEYEETLDKGRALFNALALRESIKGVVADKGLY